MNEVPTSYRPPKWIATRKVYFNKDLRYQVVGDAERLLYEVADCSSIRKNYDLMEEAFACLLANLLHAEVMNSPLVYSRSSNAYVIERKRYGYEFYTYKMIVRLVDAMYGLGLVQGVKGRKYGARQSKPSKLWATDELSSILLSSGGRSFIKQCNEVLFLKDAEKAPIDFKETSLTRTTRNQIQGFNEMLGSLNITFTCDYQHLSDKPQARVNKFYKLVSLLSCNQVQLLSPYSRQSCQLDKVSQCTDKPIITKYYTDFDHDAFLSNELNGLPLFGAINPEANAMRRVFNVDWVHGGRFYKAPHITLPSACRSTMTINGEPTVELDYSGLHIRMLYNQIGKDYRGECYVYEKADVANKDDRERIKLASLIVINSSDRKKAIKAIHNQCRKKGIHYPAGQFGRYGALVDKFGQYHKPIRQFLLSGKGLELQYTDSIIMASILERMTQRGIPALPVHDSVICPAKNEGYLRQAMMEEYEKVMGYMPIIDHAV